MIEDGQEGDNRLAMNEQADVRTIGADIEATECEENKDATSPSQSAMTSRQVFTSKASKAKKVQFIDEDNQTTEAKAVPLTSRPPASILLADDPASQDPDLSEMKSSVNEKDLP